MIQSRTSIVIGTYNGEHYIERLLTSLAQQTRRPFEVIIADDGSRDRTLAIAHAFAKSAPFPVHVRLNPQNLGFGENFLQASLRAKGDFIAFCDQDDVWRADKIERCETEFDADPAVVLTAHAARLIDDKDAVIGHLRQGIGKSRTRPPLSYSPWGVFFGFSMTFRRVLLEIVAPDLRVSDYITGHPRLAHDRWILLLANLVGSTREIAEPLVDYRQHGANVFGAAKPKSGNGSRSRTRQESDRYVLATEQQEALLDQIAHHPATASLQYDQRLAADFLNRALDQQRARNALYATYGLRAWLHWLRNIANGTYRTIHKRRFRPQAALKDLQYLISRTS